MRGSYLNDPCRELRSGEPDDDCTHDWQRVPEKELRNGPHVFQCTWCQWYGWRKKERTNRKAETDPIRVYGGKRQDVIAARVKPLEPPKMTARPMSARRGANGGYVPGGSSGGAR